jgi:hypothetical protein
MHRYVYTYGFDEKGLYLDTFYELESPDLKGDALKVAMRIAQANGTDPWAKDSQTMTAIDLRSRFQMTTRPKVVRTEFPMPREDFERYLQAKHRLGEL